MAEGRAPKTALLSVILLPLVRYQSATKAVPAGVFVRTTEQAWFSCWNRPLELLTCA